MYHLHYRSKSAAVSGLIGIVGIGGFVAVTAYLALGTYTSIALPFFIFYITLVLNTYYSIRLFASITPKEDLTQHTIDTVLVLLFFGLSATFAYPVAFAFINICLFTLAALKYTLLLRIVPHERLLKRKISIDIIGIIMGLAVLAGVMLGYEYTTAWCLAVVFIIANIILLKIRPMYVPDPL